MDSPMYGELALFSATANRPLAEEIAASLRTELRGADVFQFANENIFVRLHGSVRSDDVFIIQSMTVPVHKNIMELLIMLDTVRRDSAGRITAVTPYFAYGRTDKKDQPRVPITARLLADMITVAGADRVLTMDLHAGQIQGFFTIPVDEISAFSLLCDYFVGKRLEDLVVVAADIGAAKKSRNFAEALDVPLAIIEKRRTVDGDKTTALNVIGEVRDCNVIIFDDEIDTAGTMTSAAHFLKEWGVRDIYACATHAVFSPPATRRLKEAPFKEIVVTDTVDIPGVKRLPNLTILSVGQLLGEVIRRIHLGMSVGEMFDE
ncbi:MAG: Ribose-phosphate pyrophosphokinase [Anaerolineales bacterium]|nr:Ribose-phosphate pyrophosphokinase [Anaerolineales bacterium]